MKTRIALFRGINVGSSRSLPMKELVAILEDLGCEDVRTYIQSGNVVMRCGGDAGKLAGRIAAAVDGKRGFRPNVQLLEADDLKRAIAGNPFPEAEAEPKTLHVYFLDATPETPDLEAMDAVRVDSERYELRGDRFYLYTPDGFGKSRLAQKVEKLLGVPATARNWRTVCKIAEIAEDYE